LWLKIWNEEEFCLYEKKNLKYMFKKYFWGYGLVSAGIGWDQLNAESCNEYLGLINFWEFFTFLATEICDILGFYSV